MDCATVMSTNQLPLLKKIHTQGINVVTCGDCGTVMLVERKEDKHKCFDCGFTEDPSYFPDLFYEGWNDDLNAEEVQEHPSYIDYRKFRVDDLWCGCGEKVFYEIHDIGRDSSERGLPYPYVCLLCDENMEWEEVHDRNNKPAHMPEYWNGWEICGDCVEQKSKEESNWE